MAIPRRASGWPLWVLLLAVVLIGGVSAGLIYVGREWSPLEWLLRRQAEKVRHHQEVLPASTFIPEGNGLSNIRLPSDEEARKEQARLAKLLEAQQKQMDKLLAEMDEMKKAKAARPVRDEAKETKPQPKKRAQMMYLVNEEKPEDSAGVPKYRLSPGTWLPCVVESKFSSDIDSFFTVKLRRPIYDSETGTHLLIPQGSTVVGKASGESLVFGNERLPTYSLSLTRPRGDTIELAQAPVMDREGVTGLVSSVDQHWWRNIGASLIMGALRGGQRVLQTEARGIDGLGPMADGMATGTGQVGQRLLGRAIDTRPHIEVDGGELCNLLITKPLSLTAYD